MNISKVSAAEKKAVERDIGNIDIAAVMAILVKDDVNFEAVVEDAAVRSVSLVRATCASLFFS
jgi:hypothetical protein